MDKVFQHTIWLGVLLAIFFSDFCFAQSGTVQVTAEISHRKVYVGDVVTYQIVVRGSDVTPSIEFPPAIQGVYQNGGKRTFTSVRSINGRQTTVTNEQYTYQYRLTALQSGTITIGPATLSIGADSYKSNTVGLIIDFPKKVEGDEIEVDLARTELYANESIPVEITWWIGNTNTADFSFDSSIFPDSFTITPLDPRVRGSQHFNLGIAGKPVVGVLDETERDGVRRARMRLRVMLTPTEPGEYILGPVRVIFNRSETKNKRYRGYAESDTIKLVVSRVPTEGKPGDYNGAIGSYTLSASASNRSVNVGDPIELTLRVQGNAPMLGVGTGPDIGADPAFEDRFKVGSDGWRERLPRQQGSRVYQTTIRALDPTITEIPAIRLPSFDTETGTYRVFRSSPIPLDVRAVREVTIADAIGSFDASPVGEPAEQGEVRAAGSGTWAHAPARTMLTRDGFDWSQRMGSTLWIGTVSGGPMLALVALVAVRRRDGRALHTRVVQRAWKAARRLQAQGNAAEGIRVYLGAILGCEPDAFSSTDLRAFDLEKSVHDEACALLEFDERSAFSLDAEHPPSPNSSDILQRIRQSLTTPPTRHARTKEAS